MVWDWNSYHRRIVYDDYVVNLFKNETCAALRPQLHTKLVRICILFFRISHSNGRQYGNVSAHNLVLSTG